MVSALMIGWSASGAKGRVLRENIKVKREKLKVKNEVPSKTSPRRGFEETAVCFYLYFSSKSL